MTIYILLYGWDRLDNDESGVEGVDGGGGGGGGHGGHGGQGNGGGHGKDLVSKALLNFQTLSLVNTQI